MENLVQRYLSDGGHIRLHKRPDRALVTRRGTRRDPTRPLATVDLVGEWVLVTDGAEWVEADRQPRWKATRSRARSAPSGDIPI